MAQQDLARCPVQRQGVPVCGGPAVHLQTGIAVSSAQPPADITHFFQPCKHLKGPPGLRRLPPQVAPPAPQHHVSASQCKLWLASCSHRHLVRWPAQPPCLQAIARGASMASQSLRLITDRSHEPDNLIRVTEACQHSKRGPQGHRLTTLSQSQLVQRHQFQIWEGPQHLKPDLPQLPQLNRLP